MTDTSKPESVKKEEFKKKFDLRDKKYPSKIRKKGKRFMPENVLDKYSIEDLNLEKGGMYILDKGELKPYQNKASGGRAGYKSGGKVKGCKLAKRGKGKAYGKNS